MRFASPEFFLLLLLFPVAFVGRLWWSARRGRRVSPTLSFANFLALRTTPGGFRTSLSNLLPVVRIAALLTLVVAMARPQTEDWQTLMGRGLDIMVCLDMSGSMNAVDMEFEKIAAYQTRGEEPPTRFEMAVETLKQFIRHRQGDRVGLVVFSSEAYLKFPLTLDYQTVISQLDSLVLDNMERDRRQPGCINNCTIPGAKTSIGDALAKAYKRLEGSDAPGKLIVMITDGNDNASKLKPLDVAQYIGDQPDAERPGLYAFLVGGGPKSKLPAMHQNRLVKQIGFLTYVAYDEQVDEEKIRKMVERALGVFHVTYDEDEFRRSFSTLEQSEHLEQKVALHKDLFLPVLLVGLALLGLEFLAHVTVLRRYP